MEGKLLQDATLSTMPRRRGTVSVVNAETIDEITRANTNSADPLLVDIRKVIYLSISREG